ERWTAITACRHTARRWRTWGECSASTRSSSLSLRLLKKRLVDLRRQNKITLGQPVDLVRVGFHVHATPGQRDVRMMSLGLGDCTHAVDEIERRLEVGEKEVLGDVVLVDHLPVRHLRRELLQLRAFERRHAAAARHAMFRGQPAYSRSTHTFPFLTSR